MDTALIYTYWQNDPKEVSHDLMSPLIPSIASFRYHHSDIPVYVIDMMHARWGDWPTRLNFKVFQQDWALQKSESRVKRINGISVYHKMLSRPEAILRFLGEISENIIIHSDSDMMFVNPLLPLNGDLKDFNIQPNIGLFYFDKRTQNSRQFMETWAGLCLASAHSEYLQKLIATEAHPHPPTVHEEAVSKYMLKKYNFAVNKLSIYENFHLIWYPNIVGDVIHNEPWFTWKNVQLSKIKALHLNMHQLEEPLIGRHERGKVFMAISETKEMMESMFSEEELVMFGHVPIEAKSYKDIDHVKRILGK